MFWQENGHKDVQEICSVYSSQSFGNLWTCFRFCTRRKTTLCQFFFRAFSREDALHCVGMESRIVYFSGKSHRCRVKSCTCSRWKSRLFVSTASSAMSASWHPGCDDMKYGINCCRRPFLRFVSSNTRLNLWKSPNPGFLMMLNTFDDVCSGATLSRPLT